MVPVVIAPAAFALGARHPADDDPARSPLVAIGTPVGPAATGEDADAHPATVQTGAGKQEARPCRFVLGADGLPLPCLPAVRAYVAS